jgi:hypothetical protein
MVSKAAKLKLKRSARAGRPRKENVERYPSGDIKRSETQKEVMSVAIEARKRVHGIESSDPLAGSTIGRMFLDGKIAKHQLEAGNEYAEIMCRYYRAVGVPFPSARAQSLFSVKGHEGDISESIATRARTASNRMMEAEGLLLRLEDGPQVKRTIYNLCVMDYEHLREMPAQQLLWLKRGLNALHADKILRTEGKSVKSWDITSSEFVPA